MTDLSANQSLAILESDPLGYIHSIETCGTVDGPGIRYVAFLQGCPLRCLYCHNPDSWQYGTGQTMRASALVGDILKYRSFIRNGGVTFSGGEPLSQVPFVTNVFSRLKLRGIHTAVDTSGIIPVSTCQSALEVTDLVILDIKAIDSDLCKTVSGGDNRRALQLLDWCEAEEKPVWIRHVVVPGFTDRVEDLEALATYLKPFRCIQKVQLLPFHQMAIHKWEHLNVPYTLEHVNPPTPEQMRQANAMLRDVGLNVE